MGGIKGFLSALIKFSLKLIGVVIVCLAIVLNGAHFIINLLPDKNQFVAAVATGLWHQPLKVNSVRLSGNAVHPVLILTDVSIHQQTIKQIQVGINLWRSLWDRAWITDRVFVKGLHLSNEDEQTPTTIPDSFINWLMTQPEIAFQDVQIDWRLENHAPLKIRQLMLRVENHEDKHTVAGNFIVLHHQQTHSRFVLKAKAKTSQDPNARGILYISGSQLQLSEWLSLLPASSPLSAVTMQSGSANMQVWAHFQNHRWQSIQSHVQLENCQWRFHQATSLVTPLSLDAIWFPEQNNLGLLTFEGKQMQLGFSPWFSHPLSDINIRGQLVWLQQGSDWVVRLTQYQMQDATIHVAGKSLIRFQKEKSPDVYFMANMSLNQIKETSRYLPDRLLKPALSEWLKKALVHGKITDARLLLQGPLDTFPFDQQNGHFEVSARIQDMSLHFLKTWPILSRFNGELQFDDRGLRVIAKNAHLGNLSIEKVTATLSDLAHPDLWVDASTHMDLSDGVVFLRQSQLPLAKDMSLLEGKGPATAAIQLHIPLFKHHAGPTVRGDIQFLKDTLSAPRWSIALKKLTGALLFENQTLSSRGLQAVWLQQLFHFRFQSITDRQGAKAIAMDANGKMDADEILPRVSKPVSKIVHGQSSIHVAVVLHDVTSSLKNTVDVVSNLQGLSIAQIPTPFAKSAEQSWPSHAQLVMKRDGEMLVSSKMGDVVSGQFALQHDHSGLHFMSGKIQLGNASAVLPKKNGLFVSGTLPVLNASVWQAWFHRMWPNAQVNFKKRALPAYLKNIDLSIGDLVVGDRHWRDLWLSISPFVAGTRIQGRNATLSGQVLLPFYTDQPIKGDFDYLFLNSDTQKSEIKNMNPATLPPLDLHIADFRMQKTLGGDVSLVTVPTKQGLLVKKLLAKSALFTLNAQGKWISQWGQQHTTLTGSFDSPDLGRVLSQKRFTSRLRGGMLSSNFSLSWAGGPTDCQLKKTNGQLSVSLINGRILQLNADTESNLAVGRLLNLLSLESISHLLRFDFSSLTKKGFLFHTLTAHLDVQHGDVTTKNMEIDGPLAHMRVMGVIGLTSQENNLFLTISPYVSSSLPLIVGLAGGPIAGVTTWVMNKILEPGVGQMMSMRYYVTGSWQHPIVQKVSSSN